MNKDKIKIITKNFFCTSDFVKMQKTLEKKEIILKTIYINFVRENLEGVVTELIGDDIYRIRKI